MHKLFYPITLALAATTAQVSANPYPNSGLLYRDMREDTLRRVLPKGNEPDAIEIPAAEVSVASGPDIHVSHFVVYGNDELSDSELTDLLAPYSDRTLSSLEIQEAAEVLRKAYRTRGVFAAQVYIPPQAIVDGIVTLHVFEGVLEKAGVLLSNEGTQVKDKAISSILEENLATGEVMKRAEFERSILLVDDLPGVTSHSVIYPGTEPGEAQFLLRAEDTPRITGNVDIDNFGSYYTGESRLGATVYFNSPTGSGDQITLRAVTSGSDSNYFFLDYSTPISGSGLRVGANIDYLDYELGKQFRTTGNEGDAQSLRLFGSYPFIRSRHNNLSGRLEYAYLALDDTSDSGDQDADRRINSLSFSVAGDYDDDRWANGETFYSAAVTAGSLDIRGGDAFKEFDRQNVGADGSFVKVNLDVARLQHLTGNWSTYVGLAGQWANNNLDSSQTFYLGGPFSIPGYPTGQVAGDIGANLHLDLRYDFLNLPWGGNLQASLFYTTGWVQLYKDTWDGWEAGNPIIKNNITLSSWGVNLSQSWESGLVVRGSLGSQIGDNDSENPNTGEAVDGSDDDYRAWIQAIYYF
ncbi:MAG: ShlB/FhaC/HecB family hemolysin secretion/activation protein [Halioglobus sp.]